MPAVTAVQSLAKGWASAVWSGMGTADVGYGVRMFRYGDKTAQSYLEAGGQFGTSSVFVEGSNNTTNRSDGSWIYITAPLAANIALSQPNSGTNMEALVENPYWIRPRIGTGTGSMITVAIFGVKH